MTLIRLVPPADLPVTLEEAKDHLRVDFDDDDAVLTRLISVATARLDGREGMLGRCLMPQVWHLGLPAFLPEIPLPLPPLISIDAVGYVDQAGATQTLDPSAYQVVGVGDADMARLRPAYGTSWPSTRAVSDAVTIDFTAGYQPEALSPPLAPSAAVPERLRQAILMLVGTLYDDSRTTTVETKVAPLPFGFDDLIRDYRLFEF